MIYFIETYENQTRLIKIGYSVNPNKRRLTLQTGCPTSLKLLFQKNGTYKDEAALKRRFSRLKVRGEWFRVDQELKDFIDRHILVYGNETHKTTF